MEQIDYSHLLIISVTAFAVVLLIILSTRTIIKYYSKGNKQIENYSFLYNCNSCDHKTSRNAQHCPNCGEPNPKAPPSDLSKNLGALIALFGILFFFMIFLPKKSY